MVITTFEGKNLHHEYKLRVNPVSERKLCIALLYIHDL